MKELKKLSLKEEIDKQAEKIEKEVCENKEIEDMKVSEDMETSLFSRIQEYEYDKRIKKVHRRRKKRMIIVALAAVLVLAMGSMITGVGSKPYWRVLWERVMGDEEASVINIEDMDSQESNDLDELNVYKEINQTFGISAVRMLVKPSTMYLKRYEIDETQKQAILFFNYNNEIIRYTIYLNDSNSSFVQRQLDKVTNEYKIESGNVVIEVKEYMVDGYEERRYIANFKYRDVNYQLMGIMNRDKFDEILNNLDFS